MGGTGIVKSLSDCGSRAAKSITKRSSVYGVRKGLSCLSGIKSEVSFIHKATSFFRLRPMHPNRDWAINFVHYKLVNGRCYKILIVMD